VPPPDFLCRIGYLDKALRGDSITLSVQGGGFEMKLPDPRHYPLPPQ
jgi:hypothetical protein